jgi:hypothetical protein
MNLSATDYFRWCVKVRKPQDNGDCSGDIQEIQEICDRRVLSVILYRRMVIRRRTVCNLPRFV